MSVAGGVAVWLLFPLVAVAVLAYGWWQSRPEPSVPARSRARTFDDELAEVDFDWFRGAA